MKRDDVILLYSNGIILFRKTVLFLALFFLFSSHSKALFHSPFGNGHHPQKLKRIPASILHLLDRSAPKFLV